MEFTDVFTACGPSGPNFRTSTTTCGSKRRHQRRHVGITTGVTTRRMRDVDGDQAGYDTTWSATQVGRRTVESGLGGHDDGVSRVDDGAENASILFRKPGRSAASELGTFSRFNTIQNKGSCFSQKIKVDVSFLRWTVNPPSMKISRSDDRIIDHCDRTLRPWAKRQ